MSSQSDENLSQVEVNLSGIKAVVAIASAKGGAGKSAFTVNLAATLALKGRKVGIIDADLGAPSIAAMLGIKRSRIFALGAAIEPATGPLGLRIVAADLLAAEPSPLSFGDDEPALGASNGIDATPPLTDEEDETLRQFLGRTRFGSIDLLLIDLAPGLDHFRRLAAMKVLSGVVFVTQPSQEALQATRRGIEVALESATRVVGLIGNLTGFYCGNCHSVRPLLPQGDLGSLERDLGVPVLARFPFDPRLADSCDRGVPFVRESPDTPLAKQFGEIARRMEELIGAGLRAATSPAI